jgi:hypothetical protein
LPFGRFRMSTRPLRGRLAGLLLALLVCAGCEDAPTEKKPVKKPAEAAAEPAEGKKVKVGQNVYLEVLPGSRRVLIDAEVCLREGALEQLLTRKNKKEHEAILTADIDARKVHEALILARAKEGTPVRWLPRFRPPTGTPVKITLAYESKGRKVAVPARSWVKNVKTGKELESDWVFAGSMLVEDPLDKTAPKHYLANDGDVICVANFDTAMLDVPIQSSKDDAERGYEAWTERIPPVGTRVRLILEPVLPAKKK